MGTNSGLSVRIMRAACSAAQPPRLQQASKWWGNSDEPFLISTRQQVEPKRDLKSRCNRPDAAMALRRTARFESLWERKRPRDITPPVSAPQVHPELPIPSGNPGCHLHGEIRRQPAAQPLIKYRKHGFRAHHPAGGHQIECPLPNDHRQFFGGSFAVVCFFVHGELHFLLNNPDLLRCPQPFSDFWNEKGEYTKNVKMNVPTMMPSAVPEK